MQKELKEMRRRAAEEPHCSSPCAALLLSSFFFRDRPRKYLLWGRVLDAKRHEPGEELSIRPDHPVRTCGVHIRSGVLKAYRLRHILSRLRNAPSGLIEVRSWYLKAICLVCAGVIRTVSDIFHFTIA